MSHHPLGHHRADPLDQPRPQVGPDALDRGRQHGGIGVHLKLPAVPGVGAPAPGQPQALPDLGAQQRPHHRQQIRAGPLGSHPGDGVAGVLVGIGDPFQDHLQHRQALRRSRRRGLTGHGDHSAGHPKPRCAARQAAQNLPRPGMARPVVAPMPGLRRCRALGYPAQVFRFRRFRSPGRPGVCPRRSVIYGPAFEGPRIGRSGSCRLASRWAHLLGQRGPGADHRAAHRYCGQHDGGIAAGKTGRCRGARSGTIARLVARNGNK
jgi:hypothetical protein